MIVLPPRASSGHRVPMVLTATRARVQMATAVMSASMTWMSALHSRVKTVQAALSQTATQRSGSTRIDVLA